MEFLLQQLIEAFFGDATGYANELLLDFFNIAFRADKIIATYGITNFDALFKLLMDFGIYLVILKFLQKGFNQYILWTDGDPDADPSALIVNFAKAMFVMLCFGEMYGWLVGIIEELSGTALKTLGLATSLSFTNILLNSTTLGIFGMSIKVIFVVFYLLLLIDMIKRGLEMLILRAGMPFAVHGLMDSDGGVFRTFLQKFYQSALTVFIQVIMVKMGLVLMTGGHFFWAIAALSMAKGTPKFLQEFVILPSSGGGMNTLYQTGRMAQMARSSINWAKLAGRA